MRKVARPRFSVVRNPEGRFPRVRLFLKSPIARAVRKRALKDIFDELRADTCRKHRAVLRHLRPSLHFHVAMMERSPWTAAQKDQWRQRVREHASKLADLLRSAGVHTANSLLYEMFGDEERAQFEGYDWEAFEVEEFECLIERLHWIELATEERFKGRRGPPIQAGLRLARRSIVMALDELYIGATGKSGGGGKRHDHYEKKSADHGKPSGPFIRLVKATLKLVGDNVGNDTVLSVIDDHKAWRRRIGK